MRFSACIVRPSEFERSQTTQDNQRKTFLYKKNFILTTYYLLLLLLIVALVTISEPGLSLRSNQKPVFGQRSTSKTHMTSMSSKLEPTIWSRDTGQRIPCFDRCRLTVTQTSIIKDVCCMFRATYKLE